MSEIFTFAGGVKNFDQGWFSSPLPRGPSGFVHHLLVTSGSGQADMSVGSASNFDYTVASGYDALLGRTQAIIVDAAITPVKLGGITAVSSGIRIQCVDADGTTVLEEFTDGWTIKKNADFGLISDTDEIIIAAAGDDALEVRWSFLRAGGPLALSTGQKFRVLIQDDLSEITDFRWMVHGRLFPQTSF